MSNKVFSSVSFKLPWRERLRVLFGQEIRVRVETELAKDGTAAESTSEVSVGPASGEVAMARSPRQLPRFLRRLLPGVTAAFLLAVASPAFAIGPNGVTGTVTAANANLSSGTPTANSYVAVTLYNGPLGNTIFGGATPSLGLVNIQVTGTFTATLRFQASMDEGTTWITLPVYPVTTALGVGATAVTTATAAGKWVALAGPYTNVRVTASSYTSGTATVVLETSASGFHPLMWLADASNRLVDGNSDRATYNITTTITVPTAAQSLFAFEASASTKVRLRRIKVCLTTALQTTAGERHLVLFHTTAASSGGSALTPIKLEKADAAFGGIARAGGITTTPAVGSVTTADAIDGLVIFMPAAATTAVTCATRDYTIGQGKAPTIAAGTANGIGLADLTGGAGGTGNYAVDAQFTEESN